MYVIKTVIKVKTKLINPLFDKSDKQNTKKYGNFVKVF